MLKPEDFRPRVVRPPAVIVTLDAPVGPDHTSDFISFGVRPALKIFGFFNLSALIHNFLYILAGSFFSTRTLGDK